MGYQMTTVSGLNFYHASSAFQKCVRRGMEHEALWFGTELYNSNFKDYVWYRIKVMVSEDVGLANPTLPANIEALYQSWKEISKKKGKDGPERLQVIHAIMLLVRSPKSRIVDNKACYYLFLRHRIEPPALPDFVFDMHTIEGKRMGRGNEFFYEESAKIENPALDLVPDEFEFRDMVRNLYREEDAIAARAKGIEQPPTPPDPAAEPAPDQAPAITPVTPNLFDSLRDDI